MKKYIFIIILMVLIASIIYSEECELEKIYVKEYSLYGTKAYIDYFYGVKEVEFLLVPTYLNGKYRVIVNRITGNFYEITGTNLCDKNKFLL